jgi:hypothetical protein
MKGEVKHMKYILRKASDDNFEKEIEVNDMEDLRALGHHQFIVNFENMEITIYDWYVE